MATQKGTNAADSAPGVGDGPARNANPQHFTTPRGRGAVWLWVAISVVILLIVLLAGSFSSSRGTDARTGPAAAAPATP